MPHRCGSRCWGSRPGWRAGAATPIAVRSSRARRWRSRSGSTARTRWPTRCTRCTCRSSRQTASRSAARSRSAWSRSPRAAPPAAPSSAPDSSASPICSSAAIPLRSDAELVRIESLARSYDRPVFRHHALTLAAGCDLWRGRLASAEQKIAEAFELGRRAGMRNAQALFAVQMFYLREQQGRLGELRPLLAGDGRAQPAGAEPAARGAARRHAGRRRAARPLDLRAARLTRLRGRPARSRLAAGDGGERARGGLARAIARAASDCSSTLRPYAVAGASRCPTASTGRAAWRSGSPCSSARSGRSTRRARTSAPRWIAIAARARCRWSRTRCYEFGRSRRRAGRDEPAAELLARGARAVPTPRDPAVRKPHRDRARGARSERRHTRRRAARGRSGFEREGAHWSVAFAGRSALVEHRKGMSDLAVLLAAPGREIHALALMTPEPASRRPALPRLPGAGRPP